MTIQTAAVAAPPDPDFLAAMHHGLARRPKEIPCRFLYDKRGSELFDRICDLPEYYPTRTEMGLLAHVAPDLAAAVGPEAEIIEFGAGATTKVRLLLDALEAPRAFLPIDISAAHLRAAAGRLAKDYPALSVTPVVADFTQRVALPPLPERGRRIGFFPGSTIGNFAPREARAFLSVLAEELAGGGLLIGVDLVKDTAVLEAAYNDAQGVTAAFNLNLLVRANRELGSDFAVDRFTHKAVFNREHSRIEMHLVSRGRQSVDLQGRRFPFEDGETIHTENSYKYTLKGFQDLARSAGFHPGRVWTDDRKMFSIHWLEAPAAATAAFTAESRARG
jgi:dimethylhistidine N-methyltransferase